MTSQKRKPKIAVLIPCYNEEATIGKVIADFEEALPSARIYVFDNNSSDRTAEIAREAGATVIAEKRQGKGFVILAMFNRVIADVYVMTDGDDTYPAEFAPEMVQLILDDKADIVVGSRSSTYGKTEVRPFHGLGNKLVRSLINIIFGAKIKDPMSGFRAFSYAAVRNIPFMASGFDIETEMTIQALHRQLLIHELEVPYRDRPPDSFSKLNTFSDGLKVIRKIFSLLRAYKPLTFFGSIGLAVLGSGLVTGWVVVEEFIRTSVVTHVPLAVLTSLLVTAGFVFGITGVILHTLSHRLMEGERLHSLFASHTKIMLMERDASDDDS